VKSVIVYVEGASDRAAMTELLRPLIAHKAQQGIDIQFFEAPRGDKKASIIRKVPQRAAILLANDPSAIVVALPDLYPLNKEVPHTTPQHLFDAIQSEYLKALSQRGLANDERYLTRFKTFCFKYELEALLLAAEEALAVRLGVSKLDVSWTLPVEDQNKDHPPKHIVQALFRKYGGQYSETADAPLILGLSDYQQIVTACPQCFKPFIDFLEQLS
jgi:hypothetical protein